MKHKQKNNKGPVHISKIIPNVLKAQQEELEARLEDNLQLLQDAHDILRDLRDDALDIAIKLETLKKYANKQ